MNQKALPKLPAHDFEQLRAMKFAFDKTKESLNFYFKENQALKERLESCGCANKPKIRELDRQSLLSAKARELLLGEAGRVVAHADFEARTCRKKSVQAGPER